MYDWTIWFESVSCSNKFMRHELWNHYIAKIAFNKYNEIIKLLTEKKDASWRQSKIWNLSWATMSEHCKSRRGVDGIRTRDEGFADPCLTTWPRRRILNFWAGDGIRTHELLLGKETLYHSATPASGSDFLTESAETQNRTVDTAIFSRVLYQLSYLGQIFCC